jgi:hypothetical protein
MNVGNPPGPDLYRIRTGIYVGDLADEAAISAAVEVARSDWPEWRAA